MLGIDRENWQRELGIPLGAVGIPMVLSVVSYGEWLNLCFPVAGAIGYLLRPARLWVIWLGSVVLLWVVYGTAVLTGLEEKPASDPSQGETWWTFGLESFVFMALLVLLPMWVGRWLRRLVRPEDQVQRHA